MQAILCYSKQTFISNHRISEKLADRIQYHESKPALCHGKEEAKGESNESEIKMEILGSGSQLMELIYL